LLDSDNGQIWVQIGQQNYQLLDRYVDSFVGFLCWGMLSEIC